MTLGNQTAGRDLKVRYLYLGGFMLLGLLVLVVRLYRLQVTRGDEFSAKSVENFVKEVRIPADRGLVKDATGRILVDSRPSFDVFVTPAFCIKCSAEVLPRLASWLQWDEAQLKDAERIVARGRRDGQFRPVAIKIDVPREVADLLDAHRVELPGVDVQPTPHRNYRAGPVLSHVIGYMNEITQTELDRLNAAGANYQLGDYIGRRGIEKAFESTLRGKDGQKKRVVNARGEPIPGLSDLVGGGEVEEPTAGNNVVLSIDMRLQEEADRAFPGITGAVVAVDVRTGFVLAMMSRPGFDPNVLTGRVSAQQMSEISRDPYKPMMNRCTAMHYSPGSTFKVVTELAALREKIYTPNTVVNCPGGYRLGSRVWRCWKDAGHGPMDGMHALQHSCDTYFYHAADVLGIDPIAREARELGLGAPTGIGVLLEEPGIMPDSEYHDRVTPGGYTKGMALNTAIGQGDVNVTPLQLAMVYATIGNGGKLYRPQLVRRVESADGKVMKEYEPELIRTVDIKNEHRQMVVDALRAVVNEAGGTAYRYRLKDVVVAGKTGTAQVARIGDKRIDSNKLEYWVRDHAWFASFAPADNPEIAVVVLNEHGGHGGSASAPTAMAIIQKYFDLKKEDAARAAGLAVSSDGAEKPTLPQSPKQDAPAAVLPVNPGASRGLPAPVDDEEILEAPPMDDRPLAPAPAQPEPRRGPEGATPKVEVRPSTPLGVTGAASPGVSGVASTGAPGGTAAPAPTAPTPPAPTDPQAPAAPPEEH